jgi:pyroglutamyl-peptidase
MRKVIITGFSPFGDYQHNPSKDIAEFYNDKVIGDAEVIGLVLPATYGAATILCALMDQVLPDMVINTGFSSSVQGVRIETEFTNLMYHPRYADADGNSPQGEPIVKEDMNDLTQYPQCNFVKIERLFSRSGIPFEHSENANTFICNALGYRVSRKISEEKLFTQNFFLHIPWTDEYEGRIAPLEKGKIFLEKETIIRAIDLIIEKM